MDTLFGEGQNGLKILLFLIVVLAVLALAFWLLRRFGGGRLGNAATRGRQPRLAVIDKAEVDSRRSLLLIRRDNVEHLLIIGGPTDVVVEQNIVRAAAATLAPARPPAATDTLPRAVPLGEDTMWPLQPEPTPRAEPTPRLEPSVRPEPMLRPQRPTAVEEQWPGEAEPPAPAVTSTAGPAPSGRERRPRAADPLAGLAEELSRAPLPTEAAASVEQRLPPRRAQRAQPAPADPPVVPTAADATLGPPADQNLSEMAQRLEAALRRPARTAEKAEDVRSKEPAPKAPGEPPAAETEALTPSPPSPRLDAPPRRPFKADDSRARESTAKSAGEPDAAEAEESTPPAPPPPRAAMPADAVRPTRGDARTARPDAKPKSLYDSLEQEMASLLNRPTTKP